LHTVFGIRHHGPGSARSLKLALQSLQPDIVLIEGPSDASDSIQYVSHKGLKPPVALLIYNPKNLQQAVYYPFAKFSPEWQAMKYALKNEIPAQFIDLPQAINFQKAITEAQAPTLSIPENEDLLTFRRDPLGHLSRLAGYEDSERWWEATFEKSIGHEEIFPLIIEMITALREDYNPVIPPDEALREAWMRQGIRKAMKEGYKNIAVVCGAWHSPVLQDITSNSKAYDTKLLKGIKKVKTTSTWIPWSYDRLARSSGYGAGVKSPAWYHLLYEKRSEVQLHWLTKAARLMRKEGMDTSSAHTIEAVRLSSNLAAMRDLPMPGLEEMFEAAIAVYGDGYADKLDLIKDKLVIGDRMGKVPKDIPVVPLQKDLEQCIKSARLTKERNSTEKVEKKLDLRKPSNLLASKLLHRLNILEIKWGKFLEASKFDTGSFSESWSLKWKPDFAIKVIEASMYGGTIEEASASFILQKANETESLPKLTPLIELALKGDLAMVMDQLVAKLSHLAALSKDVYNLMDALPPLVNALRYGSTRQLDVEAIHVVVDQIVPRISIGLPAACVNIDDEVAYELFDKMIRTNRSISLLNQTAFTDQWNQSLQAISNNIAVNNIIQGTSTRILFDKEVFKIDATARKMYYALSEGNEAQAAAQWIEGFLHGSGLLLIYHNDLWEVIDNWVENMSMEKLQAILPLLRRTFSKFSDTERQKMLQLANQIAKQEKEKKAKKVESEFDKERGEKVLETIQLLIGK